MIRGDAIKKSLKAYDKQNKTNYCDLLFTREEPPDTSYIKDNYTTSIQILAEELASSILFIGPGINLYNRNDNLDKEELDRICDFNNQSNRSLSEIELAYFLEKQIKKRNGQIKCLQVEIPELKDRAIDQHSPCQSCPYELSERPENCRFRLENDSQYQTNNQLSIEEQLMNAQVNVQFLSQYYIGLCGSRLRVINEIKQFYARSQPNDAHKLIAKYGKNKKIKLIITTNCDDLLERAFRSSPANIENYGVYALTDKYPTNEHLVCLRAQKNPDDPIILKLHGCYKSAMKDHDLLITKSDFSKHYFVSPFINFDEFIKELSKLNEVNLHFQDIWFIGYILNDPDIDLFINIFKSRLLAEQKNVFNWVYCPILGLNKANRLWNEDKNLRLIPRTLESFFNDLEHFTDF
jgi:hypothetical protein